MAVKARSKKEQLSNNKTTSTRALSKQKSKYFPVTKLQIFLGIFISVGLGILVSYYFSQAKIRKPSDIIRLHLDVANLIIGQESRLRSKIEEDPTIEVVKNGLKPIQDRLSSLMVQTSQYEKMEQISGGPKHFIETSIRELDNILNVQLVKLNREALASIAEKYKFISSLSRSSETIMRQNRKTSEDQILRVMITEGLILVPMREEEEEINRLASSNFTTMDEAMNKLTHLAKMYDRLEEMVEETAHKLGFDSGLKFFEFLLTASESEIGQIGPDMEKLMKWKDSLDKEKNNSLIHYKIFWVLKGRILDDMFGLIDKVKTYEHTKREPFNKLSTMITTDVRNLKTRINNLQYSFAKKKPEG